jgi:hypothetical protein
MILVSRILAGEVVTDVKEFDDVHKAANWLVEDSYFMNDNVRHVTWVRGDAFRG